MDQQHVHVQRSSFTLIELLVVVAIIAVLAAMLLPALSRAREIGRRSVCTSNQRQLSVGLELYADDFDEVYPTHGYAGFVPHIMEERVYFKTYYVGEPSTNYSFYCPSSVSLWDGLCTPYGKLVTGKNTQRREYMGYGYFGGYGSTDPLHLVDHVAPNPYNDYYGYHWSERAAWNGKAGGPTVSRNIRAPLGGIPNHEPVDRPMISDLAFNASNSSGNPYILGNNTQNRSAPMNNHITNNRFVPSYQGVMYMDGHLEGHQNPDTNLPNTGAWGIRMR